MTRTAEQLRGDEIMMGALDRLEADRVCYELMLSAWRWHRASQVVLGLGLLAGLAMLALGVLVALPQKSLT